MNNCDVCNNTYKNPMQIIKDNKTYTFDSFECAIHLLAPKCNHCGCRVIGHGVEDSDTLFCCANCAREEGKYNLRDQGNTSVSPV